MFDQPQNLEDPKKELERIRRKKESEVPISDRSDPDHYEDNLGINPTELKGKFILDIGSGRVEEFSKYATKLGAKVVSFGPHLKDEDYRQRLVEDPEWQKKTIAGRAQEMPFPDNTFDIEVASWSVPYHLLNFQEKKLAFAEMIRILKPGGKIHVYPIFDTHIDSIEGILRKFSKVVKSKFEHASGRLVITKNN
jgi:ubiquinone/menaquinone biosynthesis C-methylase UbiE